jgi:hypothetical protein
MKRKIYITIEESIELQLRGIKVKNNDAYVILDDVSQNVTTQEKIKTKFF